MNLIEGLFYLILFIGVLRFLVLLDKLGDGFNKTQERLSVIEGKMIDLQGVTDRICAHIYKTLVIKEYQCTKVGLQGPRGDRGDKGDKGAKGSKGDCTDASEMTLGEVCAVIMETLDTCPDELKDTPDTLETIDVLKNDNNLLTTYAEDLFYRITNNGELVTEEAIREIVIADITLLNRK